MNSYCCEWIDKSDNDRMTDIKAINEQDALQKLWSMYSRYIATVVRVTFVG